MTISYDIGCLWGGVYCLSLSIYFCHLLILFIFVLLGLPAQLILRKQ